MRTPTPCYRVSWITGGRTYLRTWKTQSALLSCLRKLTAAGVTPVTVEILAVCPPAEGIGPRPAVFSQPVQG